MFMHNIAPILAGLIVVVLICIVVYYQGFETGKSVQASMARDEMTDTLDIIDGLKISIKEVRFGVMLDRCESISPLPCHECLKLYMYENCPKDLKTDSLPK